jgi:hypothetical protein
MKFYFSLIILLSVFSLISCNHDLDVSTPNFEISVQNTNINVGDTVVFNFQGDADYVTFYSGEFGHQYQYRDRISLTGGSSILQFTSYLQNKNQRDSLRLLVSTDFKGTIDSTLVNYHWIDITDKANLSTGTDNTPSGQIDLSAFISENPAYIAFKYIGKYNDLQPQETWTIKNISINYKIDSLNVFPILSSIGDAGFISFDLKNPLKKWTQSSTQIQMAGGAAKTADNIDWIISKQMILNQVNPDIGIAIKGISAPINQYNYVFSKSGTYDVVFVCKNATVKENKSIAKHLQITVNAK